MYAIMYLPEARIIRPGIRLSYYKSEEELKECLDYLYYGAANADIFFCATPIYNNLYKKAPAHLFEVVEVENG
jgi:hypothetical protein